MHRIAAMSLALVLLTCAPLLRSQDDDSYQPFSPDQLDNLLAPVALYPDPLLAQVLVAATYPDQIDEAARFTRAGSNPDDIDAQPWDVSVRAVAHYPTVLYMMADRLDWTTALGQAYVNQPDDVMASVQRLRQEAQAAGNLATNPEEQVTVDDGNIDIWPAQPQYLYVPVYDPSIVFFGSGGIFGGPVITFGTGFPIGVWLNLDCDWRHHKIYYHAWSGGAGWIARSRPYIHLNNVYVNNNLRNVTVNRGVVSRRVNYDNVSRYNSVHEDVTYGRSAGGASSAPNVNTTNKMIQRNVNVGDSRIDEYRGHAPVEAAPARPEEPSRPAEPPRNPAFERPSSNFTPRESSQRGQISRAQPVRSAPPPRAPSPPARGGGGGHR